MFAAFSVSVLAEPPKVLPTSPKGTYRIERVAVENEPATEFIVKVSDPEQRTPIPQTEPPTVYDFSFSPDEKWFAVNVHHGGWNGEFRLYQLKQGPKIEQVLDAKPAWKWLGGDKLDALFADAVMAHDGWSCDSSRLFLRTPIGGDRKPRVYYSFYYNLRTRRFELTDYLRNVNRNAMRILKSTSPERPIYWAEPEPMDPVASLDSNRARYEAAEERLNKVYVELIEKVKKKPLLGHLETDLGEEQRQWMTMREPGAEAFAAVRPKAQRPAYRMHYLAEATESRVQDLEKYLGSVSE